MSQQVEFQLKGDDSKTGRRIAKLRNKKARAQRKARLKHQGAAAATGNIVDASTPTTEEGGEGGRGYSSSRDMREAEEEEEEEPFEEDCAEDFGESERTDDELEEVEK